MQIKIIDDIHTSPANIKIIGIGGAGGNAVNLMVTSAVKGVQFVTANTDADALSSSLAEHKIQLGPNLTKGHGSGANPDIGRRAAEESINTIEEILKGTDMLFVTAGMGKGTGTGASPIISKLAKQMGILTVAVVTKPFMFEGKLKMGIAEEGIRTLRPHTDALIEIPNHMLFSIIDDQTLTTQAFEKSNEVLKRAVQSISDIITSRGLINVDFQDVKTILLNAGDALLGFGEASGEERATKATKMAITSPLLENISIDGAKGVLVNVTGNANDLKMDEVQQAMTLISDTISPDAKHIFGLAYDNELADTMRITVIATGFSVNQDAIRRRMHNHRTEEVKYEKKDVDVDDLKKPAFKRMKASKLK